MIGFIYVLQHDGMPGVYKIGMTTRSPSQRARELSSATGVPGDFDVACYFEVSDPGAIERHIHRELAAHRVEGKEFFRLPLADILRCLDDLDDRLSEYFSDVAQEAMRPGFVNPYRPLWFEENLHDAKSLAEIRATSLARMGMGGAA